MRQGTVGEFPAHIAEFGLFPGNTLRRVEKLWRHIGDEVKKRGRRSFRFNDLWR